MNKIFRFLFDRNYRFLIMSNMGFYKKLDDKEYLTRMYKATLGKDLNLVHPYTYNEKIQWLKLYDRRDVYTTMVDKVLAKEFVSKILGSEFIIPTIGVYNSVEDIAFNDLPNQFVMKCNHDSGGIIICKDKSTFDFKKAKKKLKKILKKNYYFKWREWPYKNVSRKILIEKYMEDAESGELKDYKFFTFNGKVKALFIASDRQSEKEETKFDFYDEHFNRLPIKNGHLNSVIPPKKPLNFELMIKMAEKLANNTPHLRVDFYEINGKVYFGEMTFYHWSGLVPFEPEEWDSIFGSWITLPVDVSK